MLQLVKELTIISHPQKQYLMEAELAKEIHEMYDTLSLQYQTDFHFSGEKRKGTAGVIVVDKFGLPFDSHGSLSRDHAGLMSSIMKNPARLNSLLNAPTIATGTEEGLSPAAVSHVVDPAYADCTAKIEFAKEVLTVRHKNGALGIRSSNE